MRDLWIQMGDRKYSREWLDKNSSAAQVLLEKQKHRDYPLCLCRRPYPALYIAKRNIYYLARMPGSGPQHAPDCPEFEPDASYSGAQNMEDAIIEGEDGGITVYLGSPLAIRSEINIDAAGLQRQPGHNRQPARRNLPLLGLLHLLWDKSQFNRWTPNMRGHRRYNQLYKYLLRTASTITLHKRPLSEQLYIPEPFFRDQRDAILQRTRDLYDKLLTVDDAPHRMIVIGLLKSFKQTAYSVGFRLNHAPSEVIFWMKRDQAERYLKTLKDFPSNEFQVVVIMTVERSKNGYLTISDCASMRTSNNYIPFTSRPELQLCNFLVNQDRTFIKNLSYSVKNRSFTSFLLTDTGHPYPVSLEILGLQGGKYDNEIKARMHDRKQNNQSSWYWDIIVDPGVIPELPPRS
jgi:hypothetical protein